MVLVCGFGLKYFCKYFPVILWLEQPLFCPSTDAVHPLCVRYTDNLAVTSPEPSGSVQRLRKNCLKFPPVKEVDWRLWNRPSVCQCPIP